MTWIIPETASYILWVVWALSWAIAAVWASRAASHLNWTAESSYRVFTVVGFALLFFFGPRHVGPGVHFYRVDLPLPPGLKGPLWTTPLTVGWVLVGVGVAGFLFAWWARIYLGKLWSGSVTLKDDHRVVDTGPYGVVRHPIYTGLLAAAFALAAIKATPIALTGAAVMTFGYWLKAHMEEGFLRQALGVEAYDGYRRRVPMLIPFWPK
jgi:protein-S-isoprenylcysteine O-methyltransferase Ste14